MEYTGTQGDMDGTMSIFAIYLIIINVLKDKILSALVWALQ